MKKFIVLTALCFCSLVACEKSDISTIEKDLKNVVKKHNIAWLYVYTNKSLLPENYYTQDLSCFISLDFKFDNGFLYCQEMDNNGKERYINLSFLVSYSILSQDGNNILELFFPAVSYWW